MSFGTFPGLLETFPGMTIVEYASRSYSPPGIERGSFLAMHPRDAIPKGMHKYCYDEQTNFSKFIL
jgi:hypothetical protein